MPVPSSDAEAIAVDGTVGIPSGGIGKIDLEALGVEEVDEGYQKKRLGLAFWLAAGWLTALVLAAVFADVLPIKDPEQSFRGNRLVGPGSEFLLGTDSGSRDVFSRVIYGARRSLSISLASTGVGLFVGGSIGLIAGYYRGTIETGITAFLDTLLAIPFLVLALSLLTFLTNENNEPRFGNVSIIVVIALSIAIVPSIARITRANTLVHSQREYVLASRTLGARNMRIMWREVMPNVLPAMLSYAFLSVAVLIVVEGALAFLGVGELNKPTWGNMIAFGRDKLDDAPHTVFAPSAFMFITILSLNYLGDKVRELFDVREAGI